LLSRLRQGVESKIHASIFLAPFASILALAAPPALTRDDAARLAELPLRCLHQEYPNKTGHSIEAAGDATTTLRQLHPSFYGCFDWHSSVHGHWMLVQLLKTFPELTDAGEIRAALDASFQPVALAQEADYFRRYKLATPSSAPMAGFGSLSSIRNCSSGMIREAARGEQR
jgi:hypothetical protein